MAPDNHADAAATSEVEQLRQQIAQLQVRFIAGIHRSSRFSGTRQARTMS